MDALMLLVAWMPWYVPRCLGVLKHLRKAFIYRRLGVGKRHMAESDWKRFKTFSPRHVASFDWPKCFDFQGDTCQHFIGLLMSLLTRAGLPMSLLTCVDVCHVSLLTHTEV